MRDEAAAVSPVSAAVSWTGTPASTSRREWSPSCTPRTWRCAGCRAAPASHDDLYSYRRDRQTGRFAGVVRAAARWDDR